MPYCTSCGNYVPDGARFCGECGNAIILPREEPDNISEKADPPKSGPGYDARQIVYAGVVHKCPFCGEPIGSFESCCSSCGHELRSGQAIDSVQEFSRKLSESISPDKRATFIKSYPIPSTKEDIIEFLILASTNIQNGSNSEEALAWRAMLEQAYKKAKIVVKNPSDFEQIQNIYDSAAVPVRSQSTAQYTTIKQDPPAKKYDESKSKNRLGKVLIWICVWLASIALCGAFLQDNSIGYGGIWKCILGTVLFIAYGIHVYRSKPRIIEYILLLFGAVAFWANGRQNAILLFLICGVVSFIIFIVSILRRLVK